MCGVVGIVYIRYSRPIAECVGKCVYVWICRVAVYAVFTVR